VGVKSSLPPNVNDFFKIYYKLFRILHDQAQ
jgi:hypothetical protein